MWLVCVKIEFENTCKLDNAARLLDQLILKRDMVCT